MSAAPGCELCREAGGLPVWDGAGWRVVRVEDTDFPAFYRVVSRRHVREFSDLDEAARQRCMNLVCAVERVLLERLHPAKVNLASLGNMTPHVHWHVVARFEWDSRYPHPIWAAAQRVADDARARLAVSLDELDALVREAAEAV